ncbi:MAG: GSU2086 family protein [Isosphaeraceae bacterium]
MSSPHPPLLDLDALRFEPLADRPSKVRLADLGRPGDGPGTLEDLLERLPDVLAGRWLRQLRDAIITAHAGGRPVLAALGGHVIKTGCGPYLNDWIARGVLTGVAMNGSAAIHDLELAIAGHTSEDVGPRLADGTFGFARETSELFAAACDRAAADGIGLGVALGDAILGRGGPGLDASLLVAARRHRVPATVHVAIGTDIVHMFPRLDGAAMGRASFDDFHTLCRLVAGLDQGVWLNIGSAVVMPEVFLKAVAIARNLGHPLDGLTTANLDFMQQYRGRLNVLDRPGGAGIALTGHHELLIPLLHAAVAARIPRQG